MPPLAQFGWCFGTGSEPCAELPSRTVRRGSLAQGEPRALQPLCSFMSSGLEQTAHCTFPPPLSPPLSDHVPTLSSSWWFHRHLTKKRGLLMVLPFVLKKNESVHSEKKLSSSFVLGPCPLGTPLPAYWKKIDCVLSGPSLRRFGPPLG